MVDVSIAMMTYYHEKYVARAIQSVLMQKTSYSYEIVISDDDSQDGTKEILQKFAKEYPEIIRLNINETNQGISKNNYITRCLCKGRYIATLSGDDYWIDEFKIQKQVEFLDEHPDYYAISTCIEGRFDEDDSGFAVYPEKKYRGKAIDLQMYLHGAMFGTNGMMMRNAYLCEDKKALFSLVPKVSPYIDDATECILVLMCGKVYVLNCSSVVYRVPSSLQDKHNFNAINTTIQKCSKSIQLYNNLFVMLDDCPDLFYMYKDHLAVAMVYSFLKLDYKELVRMYKSIPLTYRKRLIMLRSISRIIKLGIRKVNALFHLLCKR